MTRASPSPARAADSDAAFACAGDRPDRVVIVNDASTARGGATGLALLSAELLAARGVPVTFVAGDDGQGERLQELGVEVVAVGGRGLLAEPPLRAAVRGLYNRVAREALADWIRERDGPRVVYHLHGWSKILSPAILDALRPVATRTLIHAHDFFLACPNGGFMDYSRHEPCERRPLGAACLVTQCDKRSYGQKLWRLARQGVLRPRLAGAPWARIIMIHARMGPLLQKAGLPEAILAALPNPATSLTKERVAAEFNTAFVFVGRVEAEKGVEDAIAGAELAGVKLVVVGEGPLRAALAQRHPDVEFVGWQSREALAGTLGRARALIMPTRYPEPFGLVAAEAAHSGVPVILAQTAFLGPDFVRYGIGLCCDTRDPERLAEAFATLRDMPAPQLRGMSLRARRLAGRVSTTPEQWIGGLLRHYAATLDPAEGTAEVSVSPLPDPNEYPAPQYGHHPDGNAAGVTSRQRSRGGGQTAA